MTVPETRQQDSPDRPLLFRVLKSIVTLRGSPHSIALGTAIGVFVAFTPTIGLQMLIGAFIATLVGANRPAAIIPAWITNPVTIPPLFTFTYWVGTLFCTGPSVREVYRHMIKVMTGLSGFSWYAFYEQFMEFFRLIADIFIPLLVGGAIVGAVLGALTYPLVLWAVREFRRRFKRKSRKSQMNNAE